MFENVSTYNFKYIQGIGNGPNAEKPLAAAWGCGAVPMNY